MFASFLVLVLLLQSRVGNAAIKFPEKIYGVNLGSWLLIEPWMLPQEWVDMGGEHCKVCSDCIQSEFAFAQAYPETVDAKFKKHWQTWFTKQDVSHLRDLGINTVRIPLGYWIIEDLVDRTTEFYPRGGLSELRRGLKDLQASGMAVILDHHALPGVQSPNTMFAGRCTEDVQFYTPYNYHRALVWTAIMTVLSHLDPVFSNVVSIEAVNEPMMNATFTPGYGTFQKNFVTVIRTVESALLRRRPYSNNAEALTIIAIESPITLEVRSAILASIPLLSKMEFQFDNAHREPLVTMFMDINWQNTNPPNPADAKIGPQVYDNHLYYSFGGVADPTEEAYLTHICNLRRIEDDAILGNTPLLFGEWGVSTQFNASDAFLSKWADAQKMAYAKGAGWIYWNFKIEISELAGDTAREWSYYEGVRRGYLTKNPSAYHDPGVCDPYTT